MNGNEKTDAQSALEKQQQMYMYQMQQMQQRQQPLMYIQQALNMLEPVQVIGILAARQLIPLPVAPQEAYTINEFLRKKLVDSADAITDPQDQLQIYTDFCLTIENAMAVVRQYNLTQMSGMGGGMMGGMNPMMGGGMGMPGMGMGMMGGMPSMQMGGMGMDPFMMGMGGMNPMMGGMPGMQMGMNPMMGGMGMPGMGMGMMGGMPGMQMGGMGMGMPGMGMMGGMGAATKTDASPDDISAKIQRVREYFNRMIGSTDPLVFIGLLLTKDYSISYEDEQLQQTLRYALMQSISRLPNQMLIQVAQVLMPALQTEYYNRAQQNQRGAGNGQQQTLQGMMGGMGMGMPGMGMGMMGGMGMGMPGMGMMGGMGMPGMGMMGGMPGMQMGMNPMMGGGMGMPGMQPMGNGQGGALF